MINVKNVAAGIAIAGSLALAPVGFGSAVANAEPAPVSPQVTSVQGAGQTNGDAPGVSLPNPYAAYGGASLCGTPGLYFVNICAS